MNYKAPMILTAILFARSFLLYSLVIEGAWQESDARESQNDIELRVIAQGYMANRNALDPLILEYRIVVGQAQSLEAARDLNLESGVITSQAKLIVAGPKLLFEKTLVAETAKRIDSEAKQSIPEGVTSGSVAVPILAGAILSNEDHVRVTYSPTIGVAHILSSDNDGPGVSQTPFDLGLMGKDEKSNPARLILDYMNSTGSHCEYIGTVTEEGMELIRISIEKHNGWKYQYDLDKHHGLLARRIVMWRPNGTVARRAFIEEVQQMNNDAWIPVKSIIVSDPIDKSESYAVDAYIVTSHSQNEPQSEEFRINIPAGTHVNDSIHPNTQFVLNEATMVDYDKALELMHLLQKRASGTEIGEPESPTLSLLQRWFSILGITLLLIVTIVIIAKKQTSKSV